MKFEKKDLLTIRNFAQYKSDEKKFARYLGDKWRSVMTEDISNEQLFTVNIHNNNNATNLYLECSMHTLVDALRFLGLKFELNMNPAEIADFLMGCGDDIDNVRRDHNEKVVTIDLESKKLHAANPVTNRSSFLNVIKNSKDESIKYIPGNKHDNVEITGDDCFEKFVKLTLEASKISNKQLEKNNGKGGK